MLPDTLGVRVMHTLGVRVIMLPDTLVCVS